MSLVDQPFVGSAAARAVHGHSAGAPTVVLGGRAPTGTIAASLVDLGLEPTVIDTAGTGWLCDLADRAEPAATDLPEGAEPPAALVVAAGDLDLSSVALLDLLDRPDDQTAVATLEGVAVQGDPAGLTLVRVERDVRRVHSVGTTRHTVSAPTGYAAGVLRIGRADLSAAAALWRLAATSASAADPEVDAFDLALLALVRGGVPVGVVPLGPFDLRRGGSRVAGSRGSVWQQRLAGASRGGDGFFSTFVIRRLSRRLTGFGLAHGWTPNLVTVCSLLIGVLAAALAAVDDRWTWVAAALLLQLALVVDCVDGEIARFTRRFSALGAWLDAVGDRIKEYSLIAGVAWVGVRRGEPLWLLATLSMVLVTMRHLEDYAYFHRNRASKGDVAPDLLPVDEPRDLGPSGAELEVPGPRSRGAAATYWVKKVLHLPIAERYLLLSLGLLTFEPRIVLWLLTVATTVALVWTQGGRTAKALLRIDDFQAEEGFSDRHWGHLDHLVDVGPLGRAVGRRLGGPFVVAVAGTVLVGVAALVVVAEHEVTWLVVAMTVVAALLVGIGCRAPLRDRLAWQGDALLWGAEAALVLGLVSPLPEGLEWTGYVYLSAVAWHRYDVVYRLRDTGRPAAAWVTTVTLGVEGRWVLLVLVGVLGGPIPEVLGWGALGLIVVYAAESASGWLAWSRGRRAGAGAAQ